MKKLSINQAKVLLNSLSDEYIKYDELFDILIDFYKKSSINIQQFQAYSNILNNLLILDKINKHNSIKITVEDILNNKEYFIKYKLKFGILRFYNLFKNFEEIKLEDLVKLSSFSDILNQYCDLYIASRSSDSYSSYNDENIPIKEIISKIHLTEYYITSLKNVQIDPKIKFGIVNYLIRKNISIDLEWKIENTPDYLINITLRKPIFLLMNQEKYKELIYKLEILFGVDVLKKGAEKIYEAGFRTNNMNPLLQNYITNNDEKLFDLKIKLNSLGVKLDSDVWEVILKSIRTNDDMEKLLTNLSQKEPEKRQEELIKYSTSISKPEIDKKSKNPNILLQGAKSLLIKWDLKYERKFN